MAQRKASTILDLPHPLGPTTAASPGVISITVFWAKDLKPTISRRFKRIGLFLFVEFYGSPRRCNLAGNISQWRNRVKQKSQYTVGAGKLTARYRLNENILNCQVLSEIKRSEVPGHWSAVLREVVLRWPREKNKTIFQEVRC